MPASSLPVGYTGSPVDLTGRTRDLIVIALLGICFLLSGVAALVYQTAWTRQFALVFGTSELAVATVLAAYMGGLAMGAWLAGKWLARIRRPVLAYAALELGIGASALLLVPALIQASHRLLRLLFGGQPAPPDSADAALSLFHLAGAFVALAVPTVLMGATLPMLARHAVRVEEQIGSRIGMLYALNTTGALAGALATAFWLLPTFGLTWSIRVAAGVNVLVFVFAALLARQLRTHEPALPGEARNGTTSFHSEPARGGIPASGCTLADAPASAATPVPADAPVAASAPASTGLPAYRWIPALMLFSGAVSFFHEVLWTRMLSHVLGSSTQAFGVMVASFLAGIALGGAAGAPIARTQRRSAIAFVLCQIACAFAGGGAFLILGEYIPPFGDPRAAFYGAALLMPLTFSIGMTFPLAVRVLASDATDAPRASARVFAWNTVGAIAGALAAGFVIIPWLRFEGAIRLAVAGNCVLAILAAWLFSRRERKLALATTFCAIALVAFLRPGPPDLLLRASPLNIRSDGRIVHYDVGRSASVVVLEQDGALFLRTNGLPEAMIETSGSPPSVSGESWLTPLAVLARPRTRDMLIVGYGGGSVVENVPPSVRHIDVIELEPEVLAANDAIRSLRKRDPRADSRVNLVVNDARGALNLTSRKYDAIVSQPSHPWTAGASHLYTLEFMRLAREHLNDGGVFVQWMNAAFLTEDLLRSLSATLLDVFDAVRVYRPDPRTLLFVASTHALDVEASLAATGKPLSSSPSHYARVGINTLEDVVAALALDTQGVRALASGAPLITDDHNRMATSSPSLSGAGLSPEALGRMIAIYDPLQDPESWIYRDLRDRLSFSYIARRQQTFATVDASAVDRIAAMADALGAGNASGAAVQITLFEARGEPDAARDLARRATHVFPQSQILRQLYLRPWIGALARGTASREIAAEAHALRSPAMEVLRGTQMEGERDFEGLRELDPALAGISWTDPWKLEALQLRAAWRGRVASGDERRALGNECITLVDEAIVVQPTLILYQDRARCALAAGRTDALIESLWAFGQGLYATSLRLTREDRERTKRDLRTVVNLLETVLSGRPPDASQTRRAREVIGALSENIHRLEQL